MSNQQGFTALDVVVRPAGAGASATSYWCGVPTSTAAGCPAGEDLFVDTMNFTFPHTGHPTYTGTITESVNGKVVHNWTAVGTQTTGTCAVPDVKGDTLTAAENAIAQAWCKPGAVKQTKSETVTTGRVISQTPAVGSTGPAVRLDISQGK